MPAVSATAAATRPHVESENLWCRPLPMRSPSYARSLFFLAASELLGISLTFAVVQRAGGGKTDAEPAAVRAIAESIEAEMWKMFDQQASAQYKAKYRSLLFNLKDERNQVRECSLLHRLRLPRRLTIPGCL